MAEALYAPYLLVLLLLPLLAQWRWGLRVSSLVVVAELGLVVLVFYWVERHTPRAAAAFPLPQRDILEHMRRADAANLAQFLALLEVWVILPGLVVLLGGALSLVWSAVGAIRRSGANRVEPQ